MASMQSMPATWLARAGLLLAAALAVGAFFVPLPFLGPKDHHTAVPETEAIATPGDDNSDAFAVPQHDWTQLADGLSAVRSELQSFVQEPGPREPPVDPPPGPGPFLNALQWDYIALIINPVAGGGQQHIAWLMTEDGQRAVAQGEKIMATAQGRQQEVTIDSINAQQLVISTNDQSRTLRRVPSQAQARPAANRFRPLENTSAEH